MRYSDLTEAKIRPRTYYGGQQTFEQRGAYEVAIQQETVSPDLILLYAVVYVSGSHKKKGESLIFRGTPADAASQTEYIENAARQSLMHFAS